MIIFFLFVAEFQAWRLNKQSKLIDLVDEKLKTEENFTETEVLNVCYIALLCLQSEPNLRPAMSEVVGMLVSKNKPTNIPETPAFLNHRSPTNSNAVVSKDLSSSTSLSISVLQDVSANAHSQPENHET